MREGNNGVNKLYIRQIDKVKDELQDESAVSWSVIEVTFSPSAYFFYCPISCFGFCCQKWLTTNSHCLMSQRSRLCLGSLVSHRQLWLKLTIPCHILSIRIDRVASILKMKNFSLLACCVSLRPLGTSLDLQSMMRNKTFSDVVHSACPIWSLSVLLSLFLVCPDQWSIYVTPSTHHHQHHHPFGLVTRLRRKRPVQCMQF